MLWGRSEDFHKLGGYVCIGVASVVHTLHARKNHPENFLEPSVPSITVRFRFNWPENDA